MIEPTRAQLATAEALALKNQTVQCKPLAAEGDDLTVTVTGIPEAMGFTTRAPRVYDLSIAPNGNVRMGVAA